MDDVINRQAAIEWCLEGLSSMPSAGHSIGHWIDIDMQVYTWKIRCSNCGHERSMMSTQGVYPNFCEHCGADMRGKSNE